MFVVLQMRKKICVFVDYNFVMEEFMKKFCRDFGSGSFVFGGFWVLFFFGRWFYFNVFYVFQEQLYNGKQ